MRLSGSDRLLIGGFAVLALASLALKAEAGPPRDGSAVELKAGIVGQLRARLEAQGFATSVIPLRMQSPIVLAQRGPCRVSARDARLGKPMMTQFARDAAAIGPVHYLYRGRSYHSPPGLRIRFYRLATELLVRSGLHPRAAVPVAFAASPACGAQDFGLDEVTVAV